MKPLKLTMQAFGSYVKPGTIDFEKPEQNLFLITGDTGAGKTTIFDAITYALYDQTSLMRLYLRCMEKQVPVRIKKAETNCRVSMQNQIWILSWS